MPVTPQVRVAEHEIDNWIAGLSYWYAPRDLLLERLLNYYRDAIEVFFMKASHDVLFTGTTAIGTLEDRMRAGVFQALKWTMEYCQIRGRGRANLDPKGMHRLVKTGEFYETLVDIMTSAQDGAATIDLDPKKRLLTVHQGPDLTGFDDELVEHQRLTNPYHSQTSFVADDDRLTRRWTAGDFRCLVRRLASSPQIRDCAKVCLKDGDELFTRPTVLEFPDLLDDTAGQRVLEDMTLAPAMITDPDRGREKWRLVSMLDVPFVMVGARRLSTSDAVIAMAGALGEDHMVRRAVQIDPDQYSRVSGLRESRMIDAIRPRLEARGWQVTPHHRLHNPDKEIDVFSVREALGLVLGLKSMVRPMTPGEVRRRNDDIIKGINHTADVLPRLSGAVGFLITNGYRGDYATWEVALQRNVMIGTVEDIGEIAEDPLKATDLLKSRPGFKKRPSDAPPRQPSRFRLGRWNIELTV
jgi:hypothetical protein